MALWDTGGMERVASVTSSYYKFAEGAILVFSLDNASSFHALSQHLLDIVSYAETAKIFLCGNKSDLVGSIPQVLFALIYATLSHKSRLIWFKKTEKYLLIFEGNENVKRNSHGIWFSVSTLFLGN